MTRKSILFQRYDRDFSWNSRIGKFAKRGAAEQCLPQYQKRVLMSVKRQRSMKQS